MIKEMRLTTETAVENEQAEQLVSGTVECCVDEQLVAMLLPRPGTKGCS
ncbi:hypothetical protein ACIOG7_35960 [Streptomyces sp. NPDC087894]